MNDRRTQRLGPRRPSAGLRAILATVGALGRFDAARAERYTPQAHSLTLAELSDLEDGVGVSLPDDVLVLEALRVPILLRATGPLVRDSGLTARLDVDDDEWTLLYEADPWAMHPLAEDPTYQQVADLFVCLSTAVETKGDPRILVLSDADAPREMLLSKHLRARLGETFTKLEESDEFAASEIDRLLCAWRDAKAHPLADSELDAMFHAELVADKSPDPVATAPVEHAKFGRGVIVEASGDTVEVQFESGERRKIKRPFLT